MRLGGEAVVSDCAFLDNIAYSRGLAVDVVESANISNSRFNGNQLSCGNGSFRSDTEQVCSAVVLCWCVSCIFVSSPRCIVTHASRPLD